MRSISDPDEEQEPGTALEPLQKQLEQLPEVVQVAQGPQADSLEQLRQQFESLGPAVERQICDQVAQVRAGFEAEAATMQEKLQEGVRELVESQSQESARVLAEQQDMAALLDERLRDKHHCYRGFECLQLRTS